MSLVSGIATCANHKPTRSAGGLASYCSPYGIRCTALSGSLPGYFIKIQAGNENRARPYAEMYVPTGSPMTTFCSVPSCHRLITYTGRSLSIHIAIAVLSITPTRMFSASMYVR